MATEKDNNEQLILATIEQDNTNQLILASMQSNLEEVQKLLASLVRADVSDGVTTPLHQAVANTRIDVAVALIAYGANLNAREEDMSTPLHIASRYNNPKMVEMLIKKGAIVDAVNRCGFTPLHITAVHDNKEAAEMLIRYKAQIEKKGGEDNETSLHIAAQHNSNKVANVLISNSAIVDAPNKYQQTPLHFAAVHGSTAVATTLIEFDAKIDAQDICQKTPLFCAIRNHYPGINNNFALIVQILKGPYKGSVDATPDAIFQHYTQQILNEAWSNSEMLFQNINAQLTALHQEITPGEKKTKVALRGAVQAAAPAEAEKAAQEDDNTTTLELTAPVFVQASQVYDANAVTDFDTFTPASTRTVYVQMDLAIDFDSLDFLGDSN